MPPVKRAKNSPAPQRSTKARRIEMSIELHGDNDNPLVVAALVNAHQAFLASLAASGAPLQWGGTVRKAIASSHLHIPTG